MAEAGESRAAGDPPGGGAPALTPGRTIELALEAVEEGTIAGTASVAGAPGSAIEFWGWLELVSALERLNPPQPGERPASG